PAPRRAARGAGRGAARAGDRRRHLRVHQPAPHHPRTVTARSTRGMVILGTLALGFGLLISLMTASFWGETAGIARGGDKSGLGGLVWVLLFMAIRWTAMLVALAAAVSTGAFEPFVASRWGQYGLV